MYALLVLICIVGLVVCPPPPGAVRVPKELSEFLKTQATFLSVLQNDLFTFSEAPKPIHCETTDPTETKVAYLVLMHCLLTVDLNKSDGLSFTADGYFYVQVLQDNSLLQKGFSCKKTITGKTSFDCCAQYVMFFIGKLQCPMYEIHVLLCSKLKEKWDQFVDESPSNEGNIDKEKSKRYYRYSYREMNSEDKQDKNIIKRIEEKNKDQRKKGNVFWEILILQRIPLDRKYCECDVGNLRLRVFSVKTTEVLSINLKKSNKAVVNCFGAYFTGSLLGSQNLEIVDHSKRADVQKATRVTPPFHTVILPKWGSPDKTAPEVTTRLERNLRVNLRAPKTLKIELVASALVPFGSTLQLTLFVGKFEGKDSEGKRLDGFFYASYRQFSATESYITVEQLFVSPNGNIQNAFAAANYFANDTLQWPTEADDLITFEPVTQSKESTTNILNPLGNTKINTEFFKNALDSDYKMAAVEFLEVLPCKHDIINDDSRFVDKVRNFGTVRIANVSYTDGSGDSKNRYLAMLVNATANNTDRVIAIGHLSMSAVFIKMIRKSLLFADPAYELRPANHMVWIKSPCETKTPWAATLPTEFDSEDDVLIRMVECSANSLEYVSFGYPAGPVNHGFEIVVIAARFPISTKNSDTQYFYVRLNGDNCAWVVNNQLYDNIGIAQDTAGQVFAMQIIDSATVQF